MNYKIDTGVEISPPESKKSYYFDYPFKDMDIGQSFFVSMLPEHFKCRPGKSKTMAWIKKEHIRRQVRRYRDNVSDEFKVVIRDRHKERDGEEGLRVWRVKRNT